MMPLKRVGSLAARAQTRQLLKLQSARALATDAAELRRTPLYDLNVELGGTMVEFGGWAMPIKYPGKEGGIMHSHMHTREKAGLFDVSHMVPVRFYGADRAKFMETFLVGDIQELAPNTGTLSLIPNAEGGLIDDCICTNAGDHMYLVINAGHENVDLPHIQQQMDIFKAAGGDVSMEVVEGGGLMALQGPQAADVLQRLAPSVDLTKMAFMSGVDMTLDGRECFVTRSGYTGEDGFEIQVGSGEAASLAQQLLEMEEVLPIGLGARDSLRLEAGLCLYGNDLNPTTTPAEAVLMWTIGKRRKTEGGFVGADIILPQWEAKSHTRRRVGFVASNPVPREGMDVYSGEQKVGTVSSGVSSPCLGHPVGMAYIDKPFDKMGTELEVAVRKKRVPIKLSKMPFVPSNYYRGA